MILSRKLTSLCIYRSKTELSIFPIELKTPKFNTSTLWINDKQCNVTIKWMTNNTNYDDIENIIQISNESDILHSLTTTATSINVTLDVNVNYSITITSLRCNGSIISNSSSISTTFCKGIYILIWYNIVDQYHLQQLKHPTIIIIIMMVHWAQVSHITSNNILSKNQIHIIFQL